MSTAAPDRGAVATVLALMVALAQHPRETPGGVIWIVAGVLKLQDLDDSIRSVRTSRSSRGRGACCGQGMPLFEVVLGTLLVVGLALRVSGALSALLQPAFIVGIASAWARGLQIECGCFGGSGSLVQDASAKYPWEIARDVGLLILSALLVLWPRSRLALDDVLLPQMTSRSEDNVMATSNRRRDEERGVAAAAKVAEMRRAQQTAERRRRSLMVSAVVMAAVVVVVVVFIVVQTRSSGPSVAARDVRGSTADYGFVAGQADAPVTMIAYEDFQCPACKSFEDTDKAVLKEKVDDGTLKIEYRPIAFLDRMSSTDYSTRSLNAAACVRDGSTIAAWTKFHDLLFEVQPAERTAGLSDDKLVTYAKQAGAARSDVASCIADQIFKDWAASATEAASKDGVSATPTVRLDGNDIPSATLADPAALARMIDDAAAGGTN